MILWQTVSEAQNVWRWTFRKPRNTDPRNTRACKMHTKHQYKHLFCWILVERGSFSLTETQARNHQPWFPEINPHICSAGDWEEINLLLSLPWITCMRKLTRTSVHTAFSFLQTYKSVGSHNCAVLIKTLICQIRRQNQNLSWNKTVKPHWSSELRVNTPSKLKYSFSSHRWGCMFTSSQTERERLQELVTLASEIPETEMV